MLCGKPFNETVIVQETDAQSLRDEVTILRGELKEALNGYNTLTRLTIRLTKEMKELRTGAEDASKETHEKLQATT